MSIKPKFNNPFFPAKPTKVAAAAIQALAAGNASPSQQKAALVFIVEKMCGNNEMSFCPGEPDLTTFAEGKRFIGQQITGLLKIKTSKLKE